MHQISHGFPSYSEEVAIAAFEQLRQGNFSGRNMKAIVEQKLCEFVGATHSTLVSSGFVALQAALIGTKVVPGNRVILPNVSCPSVYHAIRSIGAIPVVVDTAHDLPLLPSLQDLTHSGTWDQHDDDVVIVPHMFGLHCDAQSWIHAGFDVIEDAAQQFRRQVNPQANATIFSFSPTKLMTIGYGGAVIINDQEMHQRIQQFLDAGHDHFNELYTEEYVEDVPYRIHGSISDFQSAMLAVQLKRYDEIISKRREMVAFYDQKLLGTKRLQPEVPFRYQLVLEKPNAKALAESLKTVGISAFPLGAHLLSQSIGINGAFPNSSFWQEHVLSLPIHEGLNESDLERICIEVMKRL